MKIKNENHNIKIKYKKKIKNSKILFLPIKPYL